MKRDEDSIEVLIDAVGEWVLSTEDRHSMKAEMELRLAYANLLEDDDAFDD